ncbi:MAG TPA: T9SS type A sorting domain-containing protein [Bacteroidales bacterium]|nr:T9SS type A sorting domain-containing protein [Bacteroidales bacterium]
MKKVLLSLVLSVIVLIGWGQSTVPRQFVVVEVGTATWCQYCPGAAMGVDDLLTHGCYVCVIENHNTDGYTNQYSNSRNNLYNISGLPTTVFDGWYGYVGGNHSNSIYNQLRPKYDTRIAEPSPCTVALQVDSTGAYSYHATITVTKVGDIPGTSVKVHFVVTQSHIPQAWQGQTELNFVNRLMVPDENGTVADFSGGDVQTVNLDFSIAPNWPKENVEFVAFIQDMDAGQGNIPGSGSPACHRAQIYQGTKKSAVPLTPNFSADPTVVAPGGYVSFTNLTTGGFLFAPDTLTWYFPGGNPSTSTDANPVVMYSTCGKYDVKLVVSKGGEVDSIIKTNYITAGPVINITADPGNLDCWYTPVTLTAISPTGVSYLWSPGGATTSSIPVNFGDYGLGTHTFTCQVTDANNCVNTQNADVTFDACTGIPDKNADAALSVYPNPTTGTFTLEYNGPAGNYNLKVVNQLNVTIFEESNLQVSGKVTKTITLNAAKGIYYLILQDGNTKAVRKIFID